MQQQAMQALLISSVTKRLEAREQSVKAAESMAAATAKVWERQVLELVKKAKVTTQEAWDQAQAAEAAVKAKDEAEQRAFEAKNKLLQAYAEGESREMLTKNLEEARAKLADTEEKLAQALDDLKASEERYEDMENQVLFSSERESLRRSLSSLAKRRNAD